MEFTLHFKNEKRGNLIVTAILLFAGWMLFLWFSMLDITPFIETRCPGGKLTKGEVISVARAPAVYNNETLNSSVKPTVQFRTPAGETRSCTGVLYSTYQWQAGDLIEVLYNDSKAVIRNEHDRYSFRYYVIGGGTCLLLVLLTVVWGLCLRKYLRNQDYGY